ncbi:VanZ family protein [Halopiger xanaduensis]|uniref:Sugar metabolism cluster protein n=1 Tax=Halopiger xanaduensis (strain DSM 18323 / JCM 14033 / SH-6) TaxID=797210 RepID=F8DA20_HALXS|nr:VanZ family protein [Halopiger xanaduensis]AEH36936.1 sugar metabolism cluster protein [Halopiger xanaduensis SH-6]
MALRIPLLPRPIRWLGPVGIAVGICYWSLVTTPPTIPPVGFEWAAAAITGVATSGFGVRIDPTAVPQSYFQHGIAYALLALGLAYALADRESGIIRKALLVIILATTYGVLMEIGQLFRPERTATVTDGTVNALGALTALCWYELERRAQFVSLAELRNTIDW